MYTDDDFENIEHRKAPSKEEIENIIDLEELRDEISNASDREIAIKTQLEYFVDDDTLRRRRVAALIFWRIALKNMKARQSFLHNLKRKVPDSNEILYGS